MVSACRWRNVAATSVSISPSTARRTMAALCSPVARMAIARASRIVAMPIVIAWRGTNSSPKKSAAASFRVMVSRVMSRVRLPCPEPGSLKPMCPVLPMPSSCRSIPPAAANRVLVPGAVACGLGPGEVSARDVDLLRGDVDVVEEILPHEPVVRMHVARVHRVVLVEVEGDHAREGEPLLAVAAGSAPDRRRSGWSRWPARARRCVPRRRGYGSGGRSGRRPRGPAAHGRAR